nr:uncharacterized protein LOC105848050 isoform X2 [Hydra vulgaris]
MSWCRAVWLEGSVEEELTIPSVWIEGAVDEKRFVRWPIGMNVIKACNQQAIPQNSWFRFPLLKEKCRHNDKAVCEGFDFTSEESEAPSDKNEFGELSCENEKRTKNQKIHKIQFQYKVIHLLTQILEEQCKIGKHYEPEYSAYHVQKFDNLEEFERFDNELCDIEKFSLLKRQLTMVGGSSCHANVKAILLKLMTNKLMACFNMEGKNKKAFKKTNIIRVIVDSMPKYTLYEVHESIGNVLKRAPDRKDGGGRSYKADKDQDLC